MLETEEFIPNSGGFRVSVPTAFDSGSFNCEILEPQSVSLANCYLSDGDALLIINNSIDAFEQVFLEISGLQNPSSTSENAGFQVTTFS